MKEKGRPALRRTMSLRCCPGARRRPSSSTSHARGSWFSSALGSRNSLRGSESVFMGGKSVFESLQAFTVTNTVTQSGAATGVARHICGGDRAETAFQASTCHISMRLSAHAHTPSGVWMAGEAPQMCSLDKKRLCTMHFARGNRHTAEQPLQQALSLQTASCKSLWALSTSQKGTDRSQSAMKPACAFSTAPLCLTTPM